jgi:hypothetical protein
MTDQLSGIAIEDGSIVASKLSTNAIAISANSGSQVNAKSINFVNTSTVTAVVTEGSSGVANIEFQSTGGDSRVNVLLLSGM